MARIIMPSLPNSPPAHTRKRLPTLCSPLLPDGRNGVKNAPSTNSGARYSQRNSFISLGICNSDNGDGVDLGIVNLGDGYDPCQLLQTRSYADMLGIS